MGILWRRWGSPSGNFTSGFEEEFERAVSRRRQSKAPEIWIYFKSVKDTSDPGEQLRRVLAFRKSVEQQRELLFGQFSTIREWETTCYDDLLKYVLKRVSPGVPETQSAARTRAPPEPGDATQGRLPSTEQELPEQLRRVSVAIRDAARTPSSARFNAKLRALGELDLARLQLLAASLLYEKVSQDTLSNHAANLVYRFRNAIGALTDAEARLALSSLLCEGNSYVPGWYWIKSMSDKRVARLLENIAITHPDDEVRISTLNLLAERPDLLGMTRTNELVDSALSEPSDEMRTAALKYATRYGDSKTADIIDSQIDDFPEAIQGTAIVAIGRILTKHDPNRLLDGLLDPKSVSYDGLITFIGEVRDTLDNAKLRRVLGHKSSDMRLMAAEMLSRDNLLTAEEAKALLDDSELRVRAIGIRRLIMLGEPLTAGTIRELLADDLKAKSLMSAVQDASRPDRLVEELFSTLSYDELIRLVDWYELDGPAAYKVLGLKHFDRFGDRVRKDLADRFTTLCETKKHSLRESVRVVLDKHRASNAKIVAIVERAFDEQVTKLSDLDNFITSNFVSAALMALARNGSPSDLPIARHRLRHTVSFQLTGSSFLWSSSMCQRDGPDPKKGRDAGWYRLRTDPSTR